MIGGATQPKAAFPKHQIIFDQLTCVGKDCVSLPAYSHTIRQIFKWATQPKVVFPKYQIIFDQLTCVGKVCVSPPAHWHTADFPNKVSKELDQLLCVQIIFK